MFDEVCKCGHYKEEHVEKWFSPKETKCLGDHCSCKKFESRPTKRAPDLGDARRKWEDTPGQFEPGDEDLFKPTPSG